jgi:hypothetical protein
VVAGNPGCLMQIRAGLQQRGCPSRRPHCGSACRTVEEGCEQKNKPRSVKRAKRDASCIPLGKEKALTPCDRVAWRCQTRISRDPGGTFAKSF